MKSKTTMIPCRLVSERNWPLQEITSFTILNMIIPADQNLQRNLTNEIILRKMSYLGVDQAAIKWFSSYLSGRTQRCNVSGKLSSARTLSCGVPQGSILGPLLFLIYINDLPNSLRGAVPRMFADDTPTSRYLLKR